jgi:hypothetical protein
LILGKSNRVYDPKILRPNPKKEYKHEFAIVEETEDNRSYKRSSEQRAGKLYHPRANILRNPDNLGMVLHLGKHLLAQTGGDLGVNLGVLDILVAESGKL